MQIVIILERVSMRAEKEEQKRRKKKQSHWLKLHRN